MSRQRPTTVSSGIEARAEAPSLSYRRFLIGLVAWAAERNWLSDDS